MLVLVFLGLKQKLLDMLLCYNPLWLRVGLEVSYFQSFDLYTLQCLSMARDCMMACYFAPD